MVDTRLSPAATESTRWVSLGRASEILGVDESTLRRWADSGRVQVYRTPGGHRRFNLPSLQALVDGRSRRDSVDQVERLAVAKIRRQLQRARQQEDGWYASLSEADRQELRDLGRRLLDMVGEYLGKRTLRTSVLDEALHVGGAYGDILLKAGLPLPSAIGAYIGFRRTIDETARQAAVRDSLPMEEALEACGQVHILGDQVLRGLAASYEGAVADLQAGASPEPKIDRHTA
jgi:excisionase family DNA binding protein